MKKFFILIILILFFSSVFAFEGIDAQTAAIQQMPYKLCESRDINVQENCFKYARPTELSDCDLLKPEFKEYDELVLNCHLMVAYYDPTACEVMPFNDANKQLCFIRARACEKIESIPERDACYNNKSECEMISSGQKKEQCINALNQKNTGGLINTILVLLAIAILIFSPIIVLIIVIKTAIDFFKHISIISWIIRIGLVLFFIILWLIVGFMFFLSSIMMKGY